MEDRAQAFTLEALVAALVLLVGLGVAVQSTSVTSLSASTADRQVGQQQEGVVTGLLDAAASQDDLRSSLLYWNASNETFHDAGKKGYYTSSIPPTPFGEALNRTLDERDVVVNVNLHYLEAADDGTLQPRTQRLIHQGIPSDDAVRAVRTVTLYDDDPLFAPANDSSNATVVPMNTTVIEASQNETFYAPDVAPAEPLFNVVRVEVVVWRV